VSVLSGVGRHHEAAGDEEVRTMAERWRTVYDEAPFFGQIGRLADDGERAQCHLCGDFFGNLGGHVRQVHGVSPHAYKERFGLKAKTGLIGPSLKRQRRRQALARRETAAFARFQEAGRRAQAAIPASVRREQSRGRTVRAELRLDPAMRAARLANLDRANAVLRRRVEQGLHQPRGWNRQEAIAASRRGHARLRELRTDPTWRADFARRVSAARGGRMRLRCVVCGGEYVDPHSHRHHRTCSAECAATLRRRAADERRAAGAADRARRIAVGIAIVARRHAHGLSLERLASLTGVSPAHLSRIERGLNVPSDAVLARLEAVLSRSQAAASPDVPAFAAPDVERAA
jgi:hypothetical protein